MSTTLPPMPTRDGPPSSCWIASDGAAGNERQALALAKALGLVPRIVRLDVAPPWSWFAPRLVASAGLALRDRDGGRFTPPWPDLAIGCGRAAALLTRALRCWSDGRCFTVQILDPRVDTRAWDVVVAPRHDGVHGDNVVTTLGALHGVDAVSLESARRRFASFGALPSPRTAVLIGGPHRVQPLDAAWQDALFARLAVWQHDRPGSFLVTTSRRTPPELAIRLRERFAVWPGTFWSGPDDGENPYPGLLAWADRLVVTPDSVNMLSEACATGKPVYTLRTHTARGKLARFHDALVADGHLADLATSQDFTPAPALVETARVAGEIMQRWNARRAARV